MTTTTTTTTVAKPVSLISLEKALVAMKKAYDKANALSVNPETEEWVKLKARKDAILAAQENIVLAMIKNNHVVSLDTKAYYDLVLERTNTSKAVDFPVLDHEGKVLDFLYTVNKEMHVSSGIVVRFWNMTKRVLSLSWYYTGRYVVNGLVYVWNKLCDLWTWIKSKFSKKDVAPVASTVAPEATVVETATPVATPVVEAAPVASEAVVEVVETPVVEVAAEEVVTEIVVATQEEEVSPLEIVEDAAEVVTEEVVDSEESEAPVVEVVTPVVVTEEVVIEVETAEVSEVAVVADAIPAALTVGAPAPKAPNTKVKASRPNASKPKATKTKKA